MKQRDVLALERDNDVLFVSPRHDIGSLMDLEMRDEWERLSRQIDKDDIQFVVVDLSHLGYFGSGVIDSLIGVWKHIKAKQGKFAICNVSPIGTEILKTANLQKLWTISSDRQEAVRQLKQSDS